jgi:hypothetical protein
MEWFHVLHQLAAHFVKLIEAATKPLEIIVIAKTLAQCADIKGTIIADLETNGISIDHTKKYALVGNIWRIRFFSVKTHGRGFDADCIVTVDLDLSNKIFSDLVLPLLMQPHTESVHVSRTEINAGQSQLKSILNYITQ